jgi:hypothetical protein
LKKLDRLAKCKKTEKRPTSPSVEVNKTPPTDRQGNQAVQKNCGDNNKDDDDELLGTLVDFLTLT